jgi:Amt family ammonium transporter
VKARFAYDDSLDVFGVHGMGGLVGTLALAVFGHASLGGSSSVAMSSQLGIQALAAAATAAYTLVASFALLKLTAALTGGLRVSDAAEQLGLDAAELGEEAYMTTSSW